MVLLDVVSDDIVKVVEVKVWFMPIKWLTMSCPKIRLSYNIVFKVWWEDLLMVNLSPSKHE